MGGTHMHAHEGSPLGFTGERVVPDEPEWAWCFQAHKFGYDDLAARLEPDARVLDIGCGEGYGVAALAAKASLVIGSDVAFEPVRHAKQKYGREGVAWIVSDAQRLPFKQSSFDVISSLQVIEHFRDTDAHLEGVARALRPTGWHYVATPNIDEMSEEEASNPFHQRDFTAGELRGALARHFGLVEIVGMFYLEDSPRVKAMRAADAEGGTGGRAKAIERLVSRLPGPLRVRFRRGLRRLARVPRVDAGAVRNAILAEDFEARGPAEESFCLIGIARAPSA